MVRRLKPNITTLARGLGGGLPHWAVLLDEKTEQVLGFGDHGSNLWGKPHQLCGCKGCHGYRCSAGFLASGVAARFEQIETEARKLQSEVAGLIGKGMMVGIAENQKRRARLPRLAWRRDCLY